MECQGALQSRDPACPEGHIIRSQKKPGSTAIRAFYSYELCLVRL